MALPRNAQFPESADHQYVAGATVAALQEDLEAKLASDTTALPEWTAHSDALSPADDRLRHISRVVGIVAFIAAVVATLFYLF